MKMRILTMKIAWSSPIVHRQEEVPRSNVDTSIPTQTPVLNFKFCAFLASKVGGFKLFSVIFQLH